VAGTKLCRECGTANSGDAAQCSSCGAPFQQAVAADPEVGSGTRDLGGKMKKGCLWIFAIFIGLLLLGAILGDPDEGEEQIDAEALMDASEPATDAESDADVAEASAPPVPPAPILTGPQRNAVRSATAYLDMQGFSREGLIEQLSLDAGEGYARADATAAVDSLDVDWNRQAARSARSYLDMMGFSCSGLIEQLSSSSGEQYTRDQAAYGAQQAGAC